MRNILYLVLICITAVSCSSASKSVKTDIVLNSVSNYDSIYDRILQVEAKKGVEIKSNSHDSVFTHVTIYRYDTIVVNGEPIIKEKIVIEKVEVSGEDVEMSRNDSIIYNDEVSVSVSSVDSLYVERHERTKKQINKRSLFTFLLFLVVVLVSYICIQQVKCKK